MFDFVKVHRWVRRFQMEGLIGIGFGANGVVGGGWYFFKVELGVSCIVAGLQSMDFAYSVTSFFSQGFAPCPRVSPVVTQGEPLWGSLWKKQSEKKREVAF
jgi:hypothetical protein